MGRAMFMDFVSTTAFSVGLWAMYGVLIRVALEEAGTAALGSRNVLAPAVIANNFGCFVLGFVAPMKASGFFKHRPEAWSGICTGLAGSITTFSGWQVGFGFRFVEAAGFEQWVDQLVQLLGSWAAFMSSYVVGKHMYGMLLHPPSENEREKEAEPLMLVVRIDVNGESEADGAPPALPAGPPRSEVDADEEKVVEDEREEVLWSRWILLELFMSAAVLTGSVVVLIGAKEWRGVVWSMWLAVIGATTRWYLGTWHSPEAVFRVWTLAVNLVGTFGLSVLALFVSQVWELPTLGPYQPPESTDPRGTLSYALATGLFGSLTTVSSWVGELIKGGGQPTAYAYGLVSVIGGQLLFTSVYLLMG